jgi:hypothetical protein
MSKVQELFETAIVHSSSIGSALYNFGSLERLSTYEQQRECKRELMETINPYLQVKGWHNNSHVIEELKPLSQLLGFIKTAPVGIGLSCISDDAIDKYGDYIGPK